MAADIEVYRYARGSNKNLSVLSYALDASAKLQFPIEWAVKYGSGRVNTKLIPSLYLLDMVVVVATVGSCPRHDTLHRGQQVDLMEAVASVGADLDAQALAALSGKPAIYHCISRVVDRRFVLETREKEKFVALMRLYERFCQVRVLAFCVMSNHFHILVEVPSPPEGRGRDWSDVQFLDHLSLLYSEHKLAEIRWWLGHFRAQKSHAAAKALRESFFRRMWDLSEFMKPLKQCFTRWFNKVHERRGTLWEERFKSVLVQDGHAARVVSAYIDLNPLRAGMVEDPKDYRWCSYGEAVRGKQHAREGIQRVMFESEEAWSGEEKAAGVLADWRSAVKRYREVLYAYLRGGTEDDGEATATEELTQQVRAFVDGVVVGTRAFVDQTFRWTRDWFGPRRKDGARDIRGLATPLTSMRDLKPRPAA